MARYGMAIDLSRCTACYGCFTACKDEYWDNDYPPYSLGQPRFGQFWINVFKKERGAYPYIKVAYMPVLCQQCNDAPCMKAAKQGAIYRQRNGIVIIDPKKAVGQRQIVRSCPYGVIFWNQEKNVAQKCTFCAHRLNEGLIPRCVQICPAGCLTFGDLDDPGSEVSKLLAGGKAEVFHPEWKTSPNVYYLDLKKATRKFVAGAIAYAEPDDCAEGAKVTLKVPQGKSLKTRANAFGNFEFDGLNPGHYSMKVEAQGYSEQTIDFALETDYYLGTIRLKPA
jgi:Fe-S-cluster-containing dehydrogenase component